MSVCPSCSAPLFANETQCEACGRTGLPKASTDPIGFAVGDVVQRFSGGPPMTVVRVDSEGILCEWAGSPSSGEEFSEKEKADSERFTEFQPAELRRLPEGGGEFGEDDDCQPE
jgi:uncharacterized protein YodC (DUF2158 family)